jgi:hypothetical protein
MTAFGRVGFSIAFIGTLAGLSAGAGAATFDFDTSTPGLYTGQSIHFSQTSGGVTAAFSSPQGSVFSTQTDGSTQFHLSQFSGRYIYPNNIYRNALDITFDRQLTSITLVFATVDYQDNAEVPGNLQLTAYDTAGGTTVGTSSAHGTYLGDTYPMGILTFTPTGPTFNKVSLIVPYQPQGTTEFFVDNIAVETAVVPGAGAVPDGNLVPGTPLTIQKGVGGAIDLYWGASCRPTDTDYEIYEGTLGDFTSHLPMACSTSGATWSSRAPGTGNRYYIVVPRSGGLEGSHGKNSNGVERPRGPAPCLPQTIASCQ